MDNCAICHRLARGFRSPKGQFCSLECLNAENLSGWAYKPYAEVEAKIAPLLAEKPLTCYTLDQARGLVRWILEVWVNACRAKVNLPPISFTPWHLEKEALETAMLHADPNNLVRSVVDRFVEECADELPF